MILASPGVCFLGKIRDLCGCFQKLNPNLEFRILKILVTKLNHAIIIYPLRTWKKIEEKLSFTVNKKIFQKLCSFICLCRTQRDPIKGA